jgi:hypothetical protein
MRPVTPHDTAFRKDINRIIIKDFSWENGKLSPVIWIGGYGILPDNRQASSVKG